MTKQAGGMTKQELRQLIRQRKREHAADAPVDMPLDARVLSANIILLYNALPDEVQTLSLIDRLTACGKTVLLPRVVSATDMELRRYTGRHDLQPGAFGIMEPTGEVFHDYGAIDVAVIPGVAFDVEGHRLGRGRGYYDRLLPRLTHAYLLGVCLSWQLVDSVPCESHDAVVHDVLSFP